MGRSYSHRLREAGAGPSSTLMNNFGPTIRVGTTLGLKSTTFLNAEGVASAAGLERMRKPPPRSRFDGRNSVGVEIARLHTQGSSFLATLGYRRKPVGLELRLLGWSD